MGVLGVVLALHVDGTYRRIALDNQRVALEEIIRLRVGDLLAELEKYSRDLGQSVQNNADFRQNLRARDAEKIKYYLEQQFHQYFVTAGILKLNSLLAHDPKLNFVAIAVSEAEDAVQRGGAACNSLHQRARTRQGADRYKVISELCLSGGYPFMHVLIPIGGFSILGYLEVVADPTYTVSKIEQQLGMPLLISYLDQSIAFKSNTWPTNGIPEHSIVARYIPQSGTGKNAFEIAAVEDVSQYEAQLRNTRIALMLTVGVATLVVALLMLYFTKKTTVDPLQRLSAHLRKIQRDSQYLGKTINLEGNKEVIELASGLNEMTVELKMLYDELQHANEGLKEEIKERQRAEVQLKMNRDHLEELVEKRTMDLAVARDTAIRASQSKSQFLANMSHELRTPLNAIIGYTELLLEDATDSRDEPMMEDLSKVHSAARHLLVLIKDILDLTKIEAGKIELELAQINVQELVDDMAHTIQPVVDKNDNEFVVECSDEIGTIFADTTKVRQALLNLLSNAAKFTRHGRIALQVKRFEDNTNEKIIFSVTDTGIGLTKKQMSRIFDPFTQADSSTTREYGGTGLGLAISRNFCQLMGGDLTVTSKRGDGSTFSIILPTTVKPISQSSETTGSIVSEANVRQQRINQTTAQRFERRSYISSILFVNKEPIIGSQFSRYFEMKGFVTLTAANANECMSRISQRYFDIVVMDLALAENADWSLVKFIQNYPLIKGCSIVLLGDRQCAEQGLALGVVDCLPVPTDKTLLQAVINSCLRTPTDQVDVVTHSQ